MLLVIDPFSVKPPFLVNLSNNILLISFIGLFLNYFSEINRMYKYLLLIFFIPFIAFAQKDTGEKDPNLNKWVPKGVAGFNISQMAFSNWAQGGDNSMTYSIVGNFSLDYKSESMAFTNSLKVAYGQTKLGDDDFRTNDNELYLENVLAKRIGWAVDPYFSNTVRTTVAPGYKFDKDIEKYVQQSNFFDPGYISQSLGFTYNKLESVQTRLGVGFQETFATDYLSYTDDPETKDEIEDFKFETGIESVTDVEYTFMDNMLYKSKLRLFTRFDALDVWDVRFDNTISAKVNKYIVVNLNVLVVYEKSQSIKTQVKEALQLGVTLNIF